MSGSLFAFLAQADAGSDAPLVVAFIAYLGLVIIIGVLTARLMKSQKDFLLGGQKLPGWAIAISERASGESAWLILGLAGAGLAVGLGELWTVIGCVSGILFIWFFVGRRLRAQMEGTDALTIPELLAQRFGDRDNQIRWIASLIIIFFFTFYVSAQIGGAGKLLYGVGIIDDSWGIAAEAEDTGGEPTDLYAQAVPEAPVGPTWVVPPEFWGILIGAVIVIAYTLLGGFTAVVWTDLLQGVVMIFALIVLPILGLIRLAQIDDHTFHMDKAAPGVTAASEQPQGDTPLDAGQEDHRGDLFGGGGFWAGLWMMLGGLAWGLGYMGQPHLMVRFMAMPSTDSIKRNRWIAAAWTLFAYAGAFAIGLIGYKFVAMGYISTGGDAEAIMPVMTRFLVHNALAGVIIAGAIAAMMSTADSQLLVVTSAFSEDVYMRIMGRKMTEEVRVRLSRLVVLLVGLAAFLLAMMSSETIYGMVSFAWSGLGASFGPAILLMVTWKRFNKEGVIAALVSGAILTIVWKTAGQTGPGGWPLYAGNLQAWLVALGVLLIWPSWNRRAVIFAVLAGALTLAFWDTGIVPAAQAVTERLVAWVGAIIIAVIVTLNTPAPGSTTTSAAKKKTAAKAKKKAPAAKKKAAKATKKKAANPKKTD